MQYLPIPSIDVCPPLSFCSRNVRSQIDTNRESRNKEQLISMQSQGAQAASPQPHPQYK